MKKIRAFLRSLFGLDDLPSVEMFKAMEAAQRHRQKEILAAIGDLTKRLEAAHTFDPLKPKPTVSDWESIQQLALDRAIEQDAIESSRRDVA